MRQMHEYGTGRHGLLFELPPPTPTTNHVEVELFIYMKKYVGVARSISHLRNYGNRKFWKPEQETLN